MSALKYDTSPQTITRIVAQIKRIDATDYSSEYLKWAERAKVYRKYRWTNWAEKCERLAERMKAV